MNAAMQYEDVEVKPRKRSVVRELIFFVMLPTIIVAVYYYFMAADVYVSESKFSVNVEGNNISSKSALGMLIPNALSNAGNLHEANVVKEYMLSNSMIETLKKKAGLAAIYDSPKADAFSRIRSDISIEDYRDRLHSKIDVILDENTGITTLRVRAFSPQEAKKLADAIVNEAEDFVNRMSVRVQQDAVSFAKSEVKKSEEMAIDVNARIAQFRNENENFDPNLTTTGILGITTKLEQELAETNTEISNLKNYMQPGSPRIKTLENKAAALRAQIGAQTNRITNTSQLANINDEYAALILERDFILKRLEVTLTALETAQAEAMKKSRYLLRIVEPTLPQKATEPRKLREVLTIFFALLTLYTLGGLIIAAIKDHVRQ